MAHIISDSEKAALLGDVDDIFNGFSRTIVVYKEPQKTIIPQQNGLFGFGEQQAKPTFTYTPVTGVFQAVVKKIQEPPQEGPLEPHTNAHIYSSRVIIKVRQDARDFLLKGKTEKIQIGDDTYIMEGTDINAPFVTVGNYYKFELRITS